METQQLSTPNLRFLHLFTEYESTPRTTVAYRIQNGRLYFGAAFCSVKDQYSRAVGRKIATGRLTKRPIEVPVASDKFEDILLAINSVEEERVPGFPRKLLK
jgi:hypothetical protein